MGERGDRLFWGAAEKEDEMNQPIEQEHPDYTEQVRMWRRYRDLYVGGEQFRQHASEYLVQKAAGAA